MIYSSCLLPSRIPHQIYSCCLLPSRIFHLSMFLLHAYCFSCFILFIHHFSSKYYIKLITIRELFVIGEYNSWSRGLFWPQIFLLVKLMLIISWFLNLYLVRTCFIFDNICYENTYNIQTQMDMDIHKPHVFRNRIRIGCGGY